MLVATLAKLGAGVLVAGAFTTVVAVPTVLVTTKKVELINYLTKDDYERLCREFQQELTVIKDTDTEGEEDKVKLLACPVDKNSNRAVFYLYDLKTPPTKEVEKLIYSDDDSPGAKVTFTLFNTKKPEEIYRAYLKIWEKYNDINLKQNCRVEWGDIEDKNGKKITCPQYTERLRVVNSAKEL